jgi:hypothetical protein
VSYDGAAPGLVYGIVQINFQVAANTHSYFLNVGAINSNFFAIY